MFFINLSTYKQLKNNTTTFKPSLINLFMLKTETFIFQNFIKVAEGWCFTWVNKRRHWLRQKSELGFRIETFTHKTASNYLILKALRITVLLGCFNFSPAYNGRSSKSTNCGAWKSVIVDIGFTWSRANSSIQLIVSKCFISHKDPKLRVAN